MHSVFLSLYLQKKERMESLKQRRTIRKYQQKDISSEFLLFALICVVSANGVCSARRNRDIIILNGLSPGLLMLYWQRKHSVLQLRKKV